MYCPNARWLVNCFCVTDSSILSILPICSIENTGGDVGLDLCTSIPLYLVLVLVTKVRGLHRNALEAVYSSSMKFSDPKPRESSTCNKIRPSKIALFLHKMTHWCYLVLAIFRIYRWLLRYGRYQWSPDSGITYNGFISCKTYPSDRPSSSGARIYTSLSSSKCDRVYKLE